MSNDGWETAASPSDGWEDAPKGASSLASKWEDAPEKTMDMSASENPLVGGLEAAGHMLSGIPAQIAGGLVGLSNFVSGKGVDKSANIARDIQESNFGLGTYKPATKTGQYYSENLDKAFAYPGDKAGELGAYLGKQLGNEELGRLSAKLPVDTLMNFIGPEMIRAPVARLAKGKPIGPKDAVLSKLDDITTAKEKVTNPDAASNSAYRKAELDGTLEAQKTLNAQDAGGNTSFHPELDTSTDHTAQTQLPFDNDVGHLLGKETQGDLFGDNTPAPRVDDTPPISKNYGRSEQTTDAIRDAWNEQDASSRAANDKRQQIEAAYQQRILDLPEEKRQEALQRAKDIRDIQLGQLEQKLRNEAYTPTGDGQGPKTRAAKRAANLPKNQRGSAPIINDLADWFTGSPVKLENTRTLDEQAGRKNANEQFAGPGHYITQSKDLAGVYGGENGRMYQVHEPFKNAYDLNVPENKRLYDDMVEHYGTKTQVNQVLRNRGHDAITFTNGRGEHIANLFDSRKVSDVGPAREAAKPIDWSSVTVDDSPRDLTQKFYDSAAAPLDFPVVRGPRASQRGSAPFINDIAKLIQDATDRIKFSKNLKDSIGAKRELDELLSRNHTWNHEIGDTIFSAKTGKAQEIVGRSFTGQGEKISSGKRVPTYAVKDSDGNVNLIREDRLAQSPTSQVINGPKNQRGSAPIINDIAKSVEKLFSKADGLTPQERKVQQLTGQDAIGRGESWAQVSDKIKSEADGPELFKNLQSGLQHAADKVNSGLMSFVAKHLAWADKSANLRDSKVIQPLEKTLKTLTSKEMIRTMSVMRREMFQRQLFTNDELRGAGMSQKEINAYNRVREVFKDDLDMQNASRAKLGMEPIKPQEAYMASMWQGNWHLPVKDMEGRLVGYLKLGSKIEMNKAVDYLREHIPDLDLKNPQIEYHGDKLGNRAPRDILGAYQDVLKNLDDSDKVSAVRDAIKAHVEDKAYTYRQHQMHFENKANIRFFQGDRPWLSEHENAYAQAKAQINYLKESSKWAPLQEALANVKEALSDKQLSDDQPNNMQLTKAYVAKSMGLSTSAFRNIESYVNKQVGSNKALHLAAKMVPTVHLMKELTYLVQLGASGGYAIATPLQALLFGPSMHMRLSGQGYEHNIVPSILKTAIDAPLAMNKATWKGMSSIGQEAIKYGEANGIVDMNIRDDNRDLGSSRLNSYPVTRQLGQAKDAVKGLLNWTISTPEKVARTATFLSFVHHLDASGMFKDKAALFQKAEDYTNHTLTDFSRNARPLAVDKAGAPGELFYVYKSPIVNMWNNLSALAKDAQSGKSVLPFVTALGMIATLAGPMNLPLINEYSDIMDYVKSGMAAWTPGAYAKSQKNPITHAITSPKEVWMEQAQHVAAQGQGYKMLANAMTNGVPSAALGVNLSGRFGGNSVDLSGLMSNSAPLGQEVKEQAPALKMLVDPNSTHATQWAYNNAPPALQGTMENKMDAFQVGPTRSNGDRAVKQSTDIESQKQSYVRRPADRVGSGEGLLPNMVGESGVRYGGMTSVSEANTKSTRAIINNKQADAKSAQESSMRNMFDDIISGRDATSISRAAQNYVANGGDGTSFQRDFTSAINKYGLTPEQRAMLNTTSLQAINKVVLINKLIDRK